MKIVAGETNNVTTPLLGEITRDRIVSPFQTCKIYVSENNRNELTIGHKACILGAGVGNSSLFKKRKHIVLIKKEDCSYFNEGDVVRILPTGEILKLWDVDSEQNALFITDKCDSRCIMCPQPPMVSNSFDYCQENLSILEMVRTQTPKRICLTGGEPLLDAPQCVEILSFCKEKMPNTGIMILTNARRLKDFEQMKKLVSVGNQNVLYCVSLHGDINSIHDSIVRVPGAFDEAIKGLRNLARFRQQIEIRFVISAMNYDRLPSMSEFIYKNFPFVTHVAFMGLEYAGEADSNLEKIIIDPSQYSYELSIAVRNLYRRCVNVSIYNVPLCLLKKELWNFARDSISAWKKIFLPQCEKCNLQQHCCGVFATSKVHSKNIKPVFDCNMHI